MALQDHHKRLSGRAQEEKNKKLVYLDEDIKLDDGDIKRQVEDEAPSPDVLAEQHELKRYVNDAINNLSHEYKTAIVLRDIPGVSAMKNSKDHQLPRRYGKYQDKQGQAGSQRNS